MRVYIAGPMSGLPGYNIPAFRAAAERLREWGHEPLDPTEGEGEPYHPHEWYMRRDLPLVATCDGMALLPGWHRSRGALAEVTVAIACDLGFLDARDGRPLDPWVVREYARWGIADGFGWGVSNAGRLSNLPTGGCIHDPDDAGACQLCGVRVYRII